MRSFQHRLINGNGEIMHYFGSQQSPITIDTSKAYYVPALENFLQFNYSCPLPGQIYHGRHNFVFDTPAIPDDARWSITVGGETWIIRQIHMHKPAEHLVDAGIPKQFEVHLVHSRPNDPFGAGPKIAVGVFITPNPQSLSKPTLKSFGEQLSSRKATDSATEPSTIDPTEFLPDDDRCSFYRYEGGLTSEPFSEDISWFVMKGDGTALPEEFKKLAEHAEHEARPTYPLNRRFVLKNFK
jgi:carbonic anhydrase